MGIPVIRGLIDRRLLVNFHVDPDLLAQILPPPFRPKRHAGMGMAGICLIRLKAMRPAGLPAWLGLSSENAAHRIAVQWTDHGIEREGVYVPRRDTNSRLNRLAGGTLFPGSYHPARFDVREESDHYSVNMRSDDGVVEVSVSGRVTDRLPDCSVFKTLNEASQFFEAGSHGYSATPDPDRFEGMALECQKWRVEPMVIDDVRSSFFEDESIFPASAIAFDCAS